MVGRGVIEHGIALGHDFVNIDVERPPAGTAAARVPFVLGDTSDYETVGNAIRGCDALIHLAAIAGPGRHPDYTGAQRERRGQL